MKRGEVMTREEAAHVRTRTTWGLTVSRETQLPPTRRQRTSEGHLQ